MYKNLVGFEQLIGADMPDKDPLVDGLLWRRDLVALAGRRREGKTTLVSNLAAACALGRPTFLSYKIPKALRVLAIYLEDDEAELRGKLMKVVGEEKPDGRFGLITRNYLIGRKLEVSVRNTAFREYIAGACEEFKPDLIIIDNMAFLISGDYNDSTKVHDVGKFAYDLAEGFNAAVVVPAHPKKRSRKADERVRLKDNPPEFFEEVMGSSHFVNSFGALWALEREAQVTYFCGGSQRFTGEYLLSVLEKDDNDWFVLSDDTKLKMDMAVNTKAKAIAWSMIPGGGEQFPLSDVIRKITDARVMKRSSAYYWWNHSLARLGLVKEIEEGEWIRVV